MSPAHSLIRAARHMWSAVIRRNRAGTTDRIPGVIVHDPDAQKAKNLDDPFLDAKAQDRVADLIAQAARTDPRREKSNS
jgi:hypothetical protein